MNQIYSHSTSTESDKDYWHRYTEVYRPAFANLGVVGAIVEFGVFHGASIRWLSDRFEGAKITGYDILPVQPDWPIADHISYGQVDQADRQAIHDVLAAIGGDIDLMIDDGSHIPQHQSHCLAEGFRRVRDGGLYVLEDICTSHPLNRAFGHYSQIDGRHRPNALNVLLALKHLRDTGRSLTPEIADELVDPQFFTIEDVRYLFDTICDTQVFKRTSLPFKCYNCGKSDFDYVELLCRCGAELYHPADSMTALIWKKA